MLYSFVAKFMRFPAVQKIKNQLRLDKIMGEIFGAQCIIANSKRICTSDHSDALMVSFWTFLPQVESTVI